MAIITTFIIFHQYSNQWINSGTVNVKRMLFKLQEDLLCSSSNAGAALPHSGGNGEV